LAEDYPEDVSIAFRHYPLNSIHPNAALAAQAAEAAGLQAEEKFFEVKNYLFEQQAVWSALTIEEFETYLLEEVAVEFDLDPEQLADDMTSDEIVEKIEAAAAYGNTIGIPGTPFLLINGQPYQGPRDYASLESIVQMIQLEDRQFNECPEMEIEQGGQYQATIVTEKGNIVIDLFSQQAPFTVNSFIFLAENGWFDNVPFHRVLPGFVAQAGDPSGTGYGTPGYHFSNEVDPSLRFDKPGVVGMANSGETSNGSQFFITYAPVPELDGGYTVFGQVVEGMDVVEALQERNPSGGGELPEADVIETILIKEL
jgi:cyclophilin family peptidyl-prolyl cis-trans isomerase